MECSAPQLGLEQTKAVALQVLSRFENEDIQKLWAEMRSKGQGDMYYFFSEMVPWSTQIMSETTSAHGFSQTQQGAMQFLELVEGYKSQDEDLLQISEKIKVYFTQT